MKIRIETRLLKAALVCAPKKDVRKVFVSVHLEVSQDWVDAVSTDGKILFCGRSAFTTGSCSENWDMSVPRIAVESALREHRELFITLEFKEGEKTRTLGDVLFEEVSGEYPAWRKKVPAEVTGEPAQYDPKLISQASKALAIWSEVSPSRFCDFYLHQNGGKAAIAQSTSGSGQAFCLIAPRTAKHTLDISWVKGRGER